MIPDPLAFRVVRRHRTAALPRDVPKTPRRIEFTSGRISMIDSEINDRIRGWVPHEARVPPVS
jgi:hypothetical protein